MVNWDALPDSWHCMPPHKKQDVETSLHAAVCWTGGKDSNLALIKAREAGFIVDLLITFSPPGKEFFAHNKWLMTTQAERLRIPHCFIDIAPDGDFRASYITALHNISNETGVRVLFSGDMDLVGTMKVNWMRDCAESAGLSMLCPLWGADRRTVLLDCLTKGLVVVMSCVKGPWFDDTWIGRQLDAPMIEELQALHDSMGLDMCGENGEYHTMVLGSAEDNLYDKNIVLSDPRAQPLEGCTGVPKLCWYLALNNSVEKE